MATYIPTECASYGLAEVLPHGSGTVLMLRVVRLGLLLGSQTQEGRVKRGLFYAHAEGRKPRT